MGRLQEAFGIALIGVVTLGGVAGCRRDADDKAAKAEAKRLRDAELMKQAYPASSGTTPSSMSVSYDATADRTTTSLKFTGLRVGGKAAGAASGATMHLVSSHKGRVRAPDNPEGSVDGSLVVTTTGAGVMAFAGAPGRILVGGSPTDLKDASKVDGYTSVRSGAGWEETVRFRIPTEALLAAAQGGSVVFEIGPAQVELSPQQASDLKELTARLKPGG